MKKTKEQLENFRPVVAYEQILGRSSLTTLRIIFFILFIVCVATLFLTAGKGSGHTEALLGSALIFFALWLEQIFLYCYHNSFYFRGFDSIIGSGNKNATGLSYEVAQVLLANEGDVTAAFTQSTIGLEVMARSGITCDVIVDFLQTDRTFIIAANVPLHTEKITDITDLASYIYMYDADFVAFLNKHSVTEEIFTGALLLVTKKFITQKRKERWWTRDRLSLHRGIGRELAAGIPYELEKFSYSLSAETVVNDKNSASVSHNAYIQKIEQVLARNRAANIMMIDESAEGGLNLLASVEARVGKGSGLNALAGLQFRVLDYELLFSTFKEKDALEQELDLIFTQAANLGINVIIIPKISYFIESAAALGINIPYLLEVYLALPTLHIIGIDTAHDFHKVLRPEESFIRRFEEIIIEETDLSDTISVLEPIALRQEGRRGVFFTYASIVSVAKNAKRYLTGGNMPEMAIDLIHEIAQAATKTGSVVITDAQVDAFVSKKTGIPTGAVSESEKDQLLNLETILHKRIIGQEKAVRAVARTMRRARVDINREDKPIGSFLFLGGSGVGKTETAKALAHTFFGNETKMVRLDMSEFSGQQTLGYLIGDENGTGILTDRLYETPYCVLLLDEFEKAHRSIQDLFLQILDEGFFTSTHGKLVNTRNTIIIATSNAGADLILKTIDIRSSLPKFDADIISHVISEGIFRPELINRFDSTIIFEPLSKGEQGAVAQLLLKELTMRVLDQGYHLKVTPALLANLVNIGYDPHSGGRGMGRVLQDVIEEKIAQLIISGEVKPGSFIHLDEEDFTPTELLV